MRENPKTRPRIAKMPLTGYHSKTFMEYANVSPFYEIFFMTQFDTVRQIENAYNAKISLHFSIFLIFFKFMYLIMFSFEP